MTDTATAGEIDGSCVCAICSLATIAKPNRPVNEMIGAPVGDLSLFASVLTAEQVMNEMIGALIAGAGLSATGQKGLE